MQEIPPLARRSAPGSIFNLLAGLLVALSCLSAACVGLAMAAPGLVPAALRPPDLPQLAVLPTLAPTLAASPTSAVPTLPPEWTATPTPTITLTPTPTDTPLPPTETPVPPTETPPGPTDTPTLTPTPTRTPSRTPAPSPTGPTPTPSRTRSPFNYTLQNGSPQYLPNVGNTAGCRWMGIAGQAFNLEGKAQVNLVVHLEGGGLDMIVFTGSNAAYGPAGYEFAINDHPVETKDTYRIQLRTAAGQPLSDVIVVNTIGACDKNLVLVNFVQNH